MPVTAVTHMPLCVWGVVILRGQVISAIDLCAEFCAETVDLKEAAELPGRVMQVSGFHTEIQESQVMYLQKSYLFCLKWG